MMTHPAMVDGTFGHLRLGRLPARHDPRTLRLENYLVASRLPRPPTRVPVPPVASWPMYGNDRLGDCTIACAAHMVQGWSELAGTPRTPAVSDVDLAYWRTGNPPADHGSAGGATDDGRVELDVLNYWRKTGIGPDRIAAYVSINPANHSHIRSAIELLGGVYIGVALPVTAQTQRTTWDVAGDGRTGPSAPGSWGGHAVPYVGYDSLGFTLVTWGGLMKATTRFHDAYVDEVYAVVSVDLLGAAGKTPRGLDLAALEADLAKIGR